MQGRKNLTPQLFYHTSLDQLVPPDNFYRKLDAALDLHFVYKATAPYYGSEGQESIDPVVFFKILLVGYLNNINSDRALMNFCADSLGIRLFLGYDLNEALPWHSTISRTRQLYGEDIFLSLFQQVLKLCVYKGMVRGRRQCVDSAFIKANASLDSLVEKEVIEDVSAFVDELNENSEFKVTSVRKKIVDQHHAWKAETYKDMPGNSKNENRIDEDGVAIRPRFLSNHTHYSPTDPDAKISVKPGKARLLNYAGQLAVDDAHHVITGACASTAGSRDSSILHEILDLTIENLNQNNISIDQVVADAGYSSGEALQYLQDKNIDAWIPNFGQYKSEREGFVYNKEKDQYECIQAGGNGAVLPFRKNTTDRKGYTKRIYRSNNSKCKACPLRKTCIGKSDFKKLDDSIHKPLYDKMHQKLTSNPSYHRRLIKRRSATVEPVLGTLINYHNMRRINARGMAAANKHVLMAALTYNLKKYLGFSRRSPKMAISIQMIGGKAQSLIITATVMFKMNFLLLGSQEALE